MKNIENLKAFMPSILVRMFEEPMPYIVGLDFLRDLLYDEGVLSYIAKHPLDNLAGLMDGIQLLENFMEITIERVGHGFEFRDIPRVPAVADSPLTLDEAVDLYNQL